MRRIAVLLLVGVLLSACGAEAKNDRPTDPAVAIATQTVTARLNAIETNVAATAAVIPTLPPIPTNTPSPLYNLALTAAKCMQDASIGFNTCTGSVKNISGDSLSDIEVSIEWVDAAGTVQSSDEALISYNPILDGQTSPWEVIGRYNPALTHFRVVFKRFAGGTILTRDDR